MLSSSGDHGGRAPSVAGSDDGMNLLRVTSHPNLNFHDFMSPSHDSTSPHATHDGLATGGGLPDEPGVAPAYGGIGYMTEGRLDEFMYHAAQHDVEPGDSLGVVNWQGLAGAAGGHDEVSGVLSGGAAEHGNSVAAGAGMVGRGGLSVPLANPHDPHGMGAMGIVEGGEEAWAELAFLNHGMGEENGEQPPLTDQAVAAAADELAGMPPGLASDLERGRAVVRKFGVPFSEDSHKRTGGDIAHTRVLCGYCLTQFLMFPKRGSLEVNLEEHVNSKRHKQIAENCLTNVTGTTIHLAAKYGQVDALLTLIQQGDSVLSTNNAGESPLHLAASSGRMEAVTTLLNAGADVNATCNAGMQPLHCAAKEGRHSCVHVLASAGASTTAVCSKGNTPLHYATKSGSVETVWHLLELGGASVDAKNKKGFTALDVALYHKRTGVVNLLRKWTESLKKGLATNGNGAGPMFDFLKNYDTADGTPTEAAPEAARKTGRGRGRPKGSGRGRGRGAAAAAATAGPSVAGNGATPVAGVKRKAGEAAGP